MNSIEHDDNVRPASYPRAYKSSFERTFAFVLAGSVLVFAGCACAIWFGGGMQSLAAQTILLAMLPVPVILFGLYIIVSTIRYRIILLPDAIQVQEGLSTRVVPRDQIHSYCLGGGKLKLILQPSHHKYTVPLAIHPDAAFVGWFGTIDTFAEFTEPKPFTPGAYPRIYRPGRSEIIWFAVFCLLLFSAFAGQAAKHPELFKPQLADSRFWGMVFGALVAIFLIYIFGRRTMGYRVTLMPDSIAVTNIHGTKTMRRCDITSYSFQIYGRGNHRVCLSSRNPAKSTYSWLQNADEKLTVPLTFDRDDEFDSWIMSLPCEAGGMPLPKRPIG